jgi:hypothetical protein
VYAVTRAFRPTIIPSPDAAIGWRIDDDAVWRNPWLSFSVQ